MQRVFGPACNRAVDLLPMDDAMRERAHESCGNVGAAMKVAAAKSLVGAGGGLVLSVISNPTTIGPEAPMQPQPPPPPPAKKSTRGHSTHHGSDRASFNKMDHGNYRAERADHSKRSC